MKYLVLDDIDLKRSRIIDYIKSVDESAEIEEFSCSHDFIIFLKSYMNTDEKLKNYLFFMDWNFPVYANEPVKAGEGECILITLDLHKFKLKTVIVSSDEVNYDGDYPYVLGEILDNCSVYQKSEYEKFIKQAKEES